MSFSWLAIAALLAQGAAAIGPTQFATSVDGTRIAFDVTGSGPLVMLLHGGGQTRRIWHEQGYVERLAREFTVVTLDLRGNGDSDKPTTTADYAVEKVVQDLLAVADKVGASRFTIWGFSYGANIGRYLASRSTRVQAMVYIGIPFGPSVDPQFRELMSARLRDPSTPPVASAWIGALLGYPAVEPGDMKCPTLWVVGTANTSAYESARAYRDKLRGTAVTLVTFAGLTHPQEQSRIDEVFPAEIEFTRAHGSRMKPKPE